MPLPEPPVALSAVSLRLAGEIGHAVLERVADGDLATAAEIDQHVAAVRAALTGRRPALMQSTHIASIAGLADGRIGQATRAAAAMGQRDPQGTPADCHPAGGTSAAPVADSAGSPGNAGSPGTAGSPGNAGSPASGTAAGPAPAAGSTPAAQTSPATPEEVAPSAGTDPGTDADMDAAPLSWRPSTGAWRRARRADDTTCPDVPFTPTAWRGEPVVPVRLLLHYACGFVEGAVTSDWWPGQIDTEEIDYESLRLAAVCRLIEQAEAAAELPAELR